MLEHAGSDPLLDVLAAAGSRTTESIPLEVEQVSEHEPGGTGTDDPDLGSILGYPQTSSAVSTISRSLAICSSRQDLPLSTVEEKPHCGERQSCSRGTPARLMRR